MASHQLKIPQKMAYADNMIVGASGKPLAKVERIFYSSSAAIAKETANGLGCRVFLEGNKGTLKIYLVRPIPGNEKDFGGPDAIKVPDAKKFERKFLKSY